MNGNQNFGQVPGNINSGEGRAYPCVSGSN